MHLFETIQTVRDIDTLATRLGFDVTSIRTETVALRHSEGTFEFPTLQEARTFLQGVDFTMSLYETVEEE